MLDDDPVAVLDPVWLAPVPPAPVFPASAPVAPDPAPPVPVAPELLVVPVVPVAVWLVCVVVVELVDPPLSVFGTTTVVLLELEGCGLVGSVSVLEQPAIAAPTKHAASHMDALAMFSFMFSSCRGGAPPCLGR